MEIRAHRGERGAGTWRRRCGGGAAAVRSKAAAAAGMLDSCIMLTQDNVTGLWPERRAALNPLRGHAHHGRNIRSGCGRGPRSFALSLHALPSLS